LDSKKEALSAPNQEFVNHKLTLGSSKNENESKKITSDSQNKEKPNKKQDEVETKSFKL